MRTKGPSLDEKIWTKQEDHQLFHCVNIYGPDWGRVAKSMGIKSKKLLEERWKKISMFRTQKPVWELNEDILLLQMVDKLGKDWEMVQKVVKTKDIASCKRRFAKIRDSPLIYDGDEKDLIIINYYWYQEDDQMLMFLHELYNGDWDQIFQRIPERNPKHIQDRFHQKGLFQNLHKWNDEKDARLLVYSLYGISLLQFEQETKCSLQECEERLKKLLLKISNYLSKPKKSREQQQFNDIMQFEKKQNKKQPKSIPSSINNYIGGNSSATFDKNYSYAEQFQQALNQPRMSNAQSKIRQKTEDQGEFEEEEQQFEIGDIIIDGDFESD